MTLNINLTAAGSCNSNIGKVREYITNSVHQRLETGSRGWREMEQGSSKKERFIHYPNTNLVPFIPQ